MKLSVRVLNLQADLGAFVMSFCSFVGQSIRIKS
jgi:hypothetical protein